MDANYLLELFNGTFQADPNVRGQAEEQLKQLSQQQPGFLGACLDILTETRVPAPIRKAAAVYLKNRVCMYWKPSDPFYKAYAIDHDEKPVVRDRIIDAIIGLDYQTKKQLIQVLHCLVQHDFDEWPGLTKQTGELLQETTLDNEALVLRLYTGLLCFLEICRHFRWEYSDGRDAQLIPIIDLAFPHLLALGNALLDVPSEQMLEQLAEMLKLILKSYKFVTYIDFPAPLRQREQVAAWGEFHGKVTNYSTPNYVGDVDDKEKLMLEISKCYKWSVANMYRLFSRYGLVLPLKKFNYREFYTMFSDEFVPHLLNNYLMIISNWCNGDRWLSDTTLYQLLQFLSHLVVQKNTWNQIKPTIDQLVGHVIWPLVCPTDSQLEMFEEDPQEYIHLYFDFNERSDLATAALGFLQTLVMKRRSYTMEPIIKFGHAQLTALGIDDGDVESAKKKEGIFTMLGAVSDVVVPQYGAQMEQFLSQLVFPALTLKYGFLKARAIEIALKYSDVKFTDENTLKGLFHGILSNFHDQQELPVSFCATLAIQSYLGHPQFTPILRNIIVRVMSRLLEISNQIDNDVTLIVMQECVENFSEQLQGYGVDLMQKLVEQFMRLARDVCDQQNQDFEDANYDETGDKVIAATGLLGTMITILLSFENSREICLKLEEVMAPAIEYCLTNQLDDFLGELAQLIENLTYLLQMVSPITWKHFSGLVACFQSRIALLYLDNLIPCLHNYLVYGSDTIRANPEIVSQFYMVFASIAADDDDEDDDYGREDEYIYACELSQTFVMKLKDVAKPYIPQFLQAVYHIGRGLDDPQESSYTLKNVNVTDVIVACLIVDPETTLLHLTQAGQAEAFFTRWFKVIPQLQRVFDLKLTALGLVTLYSSALSLPEPIVAQLGSHLVTVTRALPAAMTNLEKRKQEFDAYDVGDANYKFTADDWSEHEWDELIDDTGDGADGQAADVNFNEFLASEEIKSLGFFDKAREEPIEDPLASLALDDVDVLAMVREFIQLEKGQQAVALMSEADRLALLA